MPLLFDLFFTFSANSFGLHSIPAFWNVPNLDAKRGLKTTRVGMMLSSCCCLFLLRVRQNQAPVNTVRTCLEFRSTYLCFCPGSSYLPRSIWNASRTGPLGIVYLPPINLLQASGLCPFPLECLGTHKWSRGTAVTFHKSITSVTQRSARLCQKQHVPTSWRCLSCAEVSATAGGGWLNSPRLPPGDTCLWICIWRRWLESGAFVVGGVTNLKGEFKGRYNVSLRIE